MYNLKYEVIKQNDETVEIIKENVKQPNFNEKVLSFIDTETGQFIIYDFNNTELPIKGIKNIRIEKIEKN